IVAYQVQSHQRGMGLSSSLIPSHSWPVVETPVTSSICFSLIFIVLERNVLCVVGFLFASRAESKKHNEDKEDRHAKAAPAIGECAHGVVIHCLVPSIWLEEIDRRSRNQPMCRASADRLSARPFRRSCPDCRQSHRLWPLDSAPPTPMYPHLVLPAL